MKLMMCPRCQGKGKVVDPREEGKRLRAFRLGHNVSLRQLAIILGVSPAYLSDVELGKRGTEREWMELYDKALEDK